jgi:hypothetical protein
MPKRSLEAATTQIEEKATTVGITSTKDSKKKLKKKKKKKESPEIVEEVAASDLDELFGGLSRAKKQQQMVRGLYFCENLQCHAMLLIEQTKALLMLPRRTSYKIKGKKVGSTRHVRRPMLTRAPNVTPQAPYLR